MPIISGKQTAPTVPARIGMLKRTLRSNRAVANVDLLRYPAEDRKEISLADVLEDHLQRHRHQKERDDPGQAHAGRSSRGTRSGSRK